MEVLKKIATDLKIAAHAEKNSV